MYHHQSACSQEDIRYIKSGSEEKERKEIDKQQFVDLPILV